VRPLLAGDECLSLFIAPPRAALHAAIDQRFDQMLAAGALDEAEALRRRQLDPALPIMRAHGVPHLIAHLEGRIPLDEAARLGKRDTRAYVKRQFTFARHQLPEFVSLAWDNLSPQPSARVRRSP
jgi:tRNA dimethylallyltransferase